LFSTIEADMRCERSLSLAASTAALLSFFAISASGQDKVNFSDHVLPLIEANCSKCHNSDKKKADLDLTSFQGSLKGSGSGVIVVSGNVDGSKLWKCLNHAEEPYMPPNRPKLSDKELEIFKKWINGGLLENSGAKAIVASKPANDLTLKPEALGKPEGPPPMPGTLPGDCVVHTARCGPVTGLTASPWAPLVAVAGEKQVLLFQADTLEPLGILPFAEGEPIGLKFSRNGKLLLAHGGVGAKSGRVVLWDITSGDKVSTVGQENDVVLAADIRPDQSQVALGGPNRLVKIYSTKTGELQHKIKKHTDWVTAAAFSPNGQVLATADRNGGISLWDPDNATELFTLAGHKSCVTALSWRGDSKLLASSSEDGTVKLWEMQEGKQFKSWNAHGSGALCVNYANDGRLVSCGRDKNVVVWDGNGNKVKQMEFSGGIPLRAVFDYDGARVTASDIEGHVGVWTAADGKRVGSLDINPPPLAEQIAAAQQRLGEIIARLDAGEKDAITNQLQEATVALDKLQSAEAASRLFRASEALITKKQQQEKLEALAAANAEALKEAEQQISTAATPAAKAEVQKKAKAVRAELAQNQAAAKKLSLEIKAEQARLEKLRKGA
jgi:WD40 repeat protein